MKLNPDQFSSLLDNIDEKTRYYIFGGILLFFFLLDYFLLMGPQLGALSKINPEIKILKEDISKAKTNIKMTSQYENQVDDLKRKVAIMNLRVKSREEVPMILENISVLANTNGVKIDNIMPSTADQEILLENDERIYYSLPITLEASSGYHDFGRFINNIETGDIFLKINTFTISSGKDSKRHNINLILGAVVFEEK